MNAREDHMVLVEHICIYIYMLLFSLCIFHFPGNDIRKLMSIDTEMKQILKSKLGIV